MPQWRGSVSWHATPRREHRERCAANPDLLAQASAQQRSRLIAGMSYRRKRASWGTVVAVAKHRRHGAHTPGRCVTESEEHSSRSATAQPLAGTENPRQVVESIDRYTRPPSSSQVLCRGKASIWRLTSIFGGRKKRAAMITAIRKPLDTRTAAGCYSPTWSHALLGQFLARVEGIEL